MVGMMDSQTPAIGVESEPEREVLKSLRILTKKVKITGE